MSSYVGALVINVYRYVLTRPMKTLMSTLGDMGRLSIYADSLRPALSASKIFISIGQTTKIKNDCCLGWYLVLDM